MFEDKTLICKECGSEFVFSAGEQEFYAEKGLENEPQRCKECRIAFKKARQAARTYHEAVCAKCGAACRVPFEPTQDRPVYCSTCFEEIRNNG
ncbi:MAG: zinc-ribbon domain containing protein [Clostridiales bacterium]|nr:zinc-ribbon domain containing protein [Clostridiales bacterium]